MTKWVEIGQTEIIAETERAVCLRFANGSCAHRDQWIPRSCYRVVTQDNFEVQEVISWFVSRNRLWNLINLRQGPC